MSHPLTEKYQAGQYVGEFTRFPNDEYFQIEAHEKDWSVGWSTEQGLISSLQRLTDLTGVHILPHIKTQQTPLFNRSKSLHTEIVDADRLLNFSDRKLQRIQFAALGMRGLRFTWTNMQQKFDTDQRRYSEASLLLQYTAEHVELGSEFAEQTATPLPKSIADVAIRNFVQV